MSCVNMVELITCIFLIFALGLFTSVKIFKVIDFDFSYYFFETAVYSGLWKGSFEKNYTQESCIIRKNSNLVKFRTTSTPELKGLQVVSFQSVRSNTYYLENSMEVTIEPILFEVVNLRGR